MAPDLTKKMELSHEAYAAWWGSLDEADRQEFTFIYGGDDYLGRFVCALDYLTIQKIPFDTPDSMFVTAYWMAAIAFEPELTIDSPGLRNRAVRAWHSDAVQTLFDRVRYRSVRQGSIRLQNKLFKLGELIADDAMSEDATWKQRNDSANALARIIQLTDLQEQAVRADRTKRGLERARQALASAGPDSLSERDLRVMLKAAVGHMGKEKVLALMSGDNGGQSSS